MENNGLPGGIFSGINSGMLGLELPIHNHHHHQQQQPQQQTQQQNHHQNPQNSHNFHHFSDQSIKQHSYPYATAKPKPQSPLSDNEDEPSFYGDDSTTSDGKRKATFCSSSSSMSPWQRMKWTDNMVRLLIMAVFYIGDEAGSEPIDPAGKKKVGALSQKKGKWKSVSAAMMEKGFYVSPQQCEDKFNDLNKRYKRVNEILGKGTACKVVENQNLLESMELSSKMKEEVKKLLNSKHLFFREMCAYHNSCGHGGLPIVDDQSHQIQNPQFLPNSLEEVVPKTAKRVPIDELEEEDEEEEEDDESDEEGDHHHDVVDEDEHEDDDDEKPTRKRQRTIPTTTPTQVFSLSSAVMQQLNSELMGVIQDGGKSSWEKKHWMKVRLMQLEEQQVGFQYQAFELEKQRLKWVKFSSKKEREMERSKLENERRRLENERMVLLIRQKELELFDLQQVHHQQQFSSNKRGDPSSVTG